MSENAGAHERDDDPFRWELADRIRQATGEFVVVHASATDDRLAVGIRDGYASGAERGIVVMFDLVEGRVRFTADIPRPNAPHLLPSGGVILEDWWSPADTLGGSFLCLSADGQEAWRHVFKANVGNSAVSRDGRSALVTTFRSDFAAHSNRLWFIDASSGALLWSREFPGKHEPRFAVEFSGEQLFAIVDTTVPGKYRRFAFDDAGRLPREFDEYAFNFDVEHRGIIPVIAPRVRDALASNPPNLDELERLLSLVDGHDITPDDQAKVARWRGELAEAQGSITKAVQHYEEALALNPRIGVKGRLERLNKQLR